LTSIFTYVSGRAGNPYRRKVVPAQLRDAPALPEHAFGGRVVKHHRDAVRRRVHVRLQMAVAEGDRPCERREGVLIAVGGAATMRKRERPTRLDRGQERMRRLHAGEYAPSG